MIESPNFFCCVAIKDLGYRKKRAEGEFTIITIMIDIAYQYRFVDNDIQSMILFVQKHASYPLVRRNININVCFHCRFDFHLLFKKASSECPKADVFMTKDYQLIGRNIIPYTLKQCYL